MKNNKRHYKKVSKVSVETVMIHIAIECIWGVIGLSFGKLILGFIPESGVESGMIPDATSVFVSAISSVAYSKHKHKKNKSP